MERIIEVNKINYLINYDRSKTITEQSFSDWGDAGIDVSGWNLWAKEKTDSIEPVMQKIHDFVTDPHIYLPLGALLLTIASGGATSPLLAASLAGASLSLEIADVVLYWNEGDYTSAGIGAIFALIPVAQLAKTLGLRFVSEMTESQIKLFLRKIKEGLDLTNKERQLAESIAENTAELGLLISRQAAKSMTASYLGRYTGKTLLLAILRLRRLGIHIHRIGWKITALGGAFVSIMALGSILGEEFAEFTGAKPPKQYAELTDEQKLEVKEEIYNKMENSPEEIREQAYNATVVLIETSDEEKNSQIAEVLKKQQEELDKLGF